MSVVVSGPEVLDLSKDSDKMLIQSEFKCSKDGEFQLKEYTGEEA